MRYEYGLPLNFLFKTEKRPKNSDPKTDNETVNRTF
jgi:hypothetical protein